MKRKLIVCLMLLSLLLPSAIAWETPCIDEPFEIGRAHV